MPDSQELLRRLPAVDELLRHPQVEAWLGESSRAEVLAALRATLDDAREQIRAGGDRAELEALTQPARLIARARERAQAPPERSLLPVLNATGIIVHTNLGRSRLSQQAIEALCAAARGYTNLELDLDSGERGSRHVHLEALLPEITGAEAGFAVNNNAAAVLLLLNTIAEGREVIVSRGHLIEIGGSFRLPEIMAKSGCRLIEVGTTNRTRLSDYENAITADTAAILKVHSSNFKQVGFTEETPLEQLAALAHDLGLVLMEDLGSGALVNLDARGLPHEPTCQEALAAGADVVCFSADKLLGGPQAGLIVGSADLVQAAKRNPLARAVRLGKLTIAALEQTLRAYREQDLAFATIPTLRAASEPLQSVAARAEKLATLLTEHNLTDLQVEITEADAAVGGGSLPGEQIPSQAVALRPRDLSADDLARRLRTSSPAVLGRIHHGALLLDCRTLTDAELPAVAAAVQRAVT